MKLIVLGLAVALLGACAPRQMTPFVQGNTAIYPTTEREQDLLDNCLTEIRVDYGYYPPGLVDRCYRYKLRKTSTTTMY